MLITSSITVSVSGVTSILGQRRLGSPGLRFDTLAPVGFTGRDIFWHLHSGTCLVDELRFVHDEPHVGAKCELLGGVLTNTISWMIRAWVVPGWENPNGTFAHDHPGVR